MATRAFIALWDLQGGSGGSYKGIYSHWDGDFAVAGKILGTHYNDPKKVNELIALGDVSILGAEIGQKHDFDKDYDKARANNWTTAYGRDRGEKNVGVKTFRTIANFLQNASNMDAEYVYVFVAATKTWFGAKLNSTNAKNLQWHVMPGEAVVQGLPPFLAANKEAFFKGVYNVLFENHEKKDPDKYRVEFEKKDEITFKGVTPKEKK